MSILKILSGDREDGSIPSSSAYENKIFIIIYMKFLENISIYIIYKDSSLKF